MEGSETGSREGSDIACYEGICNHDEAGLAQQISKSHQSCQYSVSVHVLILQEMTRMHMAVLKTRRME